MHLNRKIAIVGLGYVGLPVAVAFGKKHKVIGFDINEDRINELQKGLDYTNAIDSADLKEAEIDFTHSGEKLSQANFIIVAVPTPIDKYNQPDLTPLLKASETVGKHLTKGTIVVFESTVYPGATEDECVPVLENISGLKCGEDFFIGYSPERINPGDKEHTFTTITKVVSAQTKEVLEVVAEVYGSVIKAGIYKASSIKVAEAAKVIENTQRDVNIALMNELALIFSRIGIDTVDVLEAASTKWNFLKFSPGLVGGHCIGVDPYYLTHKAQAVGHFPEVILAGRRTNDGMGKYIAQVLVKKLIKHKLYIQGAKVTILGLTFKEDVPDLRNSKVVDVIHELKEYNIDIQVIDQEANTVEAFNEYGIQLTKQEDLTPSDAVILAVPHKKYVQDGWNLVSSLLKNKSGIVLDIRSVLDKSKTPQNIDLWRL